jgi:hypothetical protein
MDRIQNWYNTTPIYDVNEAGFPVVVGYVVHLHPYNYDLVYRVEGEVVYADLTELLSLHPDFYFPPPLPRARGKISVSMSDIEKALGRKLRSAEDWTPQPRQLSNLVSKKSNEFDPLSFEPSMSDLVTEKEIQNRIVQVDAVLQTSKRLLQRAVRAQQALKIMSFNHHENMEKLIGNGEFTSLPYGLTKGDFRHSARFVDPSVAHYKGTMTMKRKAGKDLADRLEEGQLAAEFDIKFWGKYAYLLSVVMPEYHTYGAYLGEGKGARTTSSINEGLGKFFDFYERQQWVFGLVEEWS